MIIGISGKIGSGKNTVANIIQYLTSDVEKTINLQRYIELVDKFGITYGTTRSKWEQKSFANKLKQVASLLTGVPIENFESQDFKKQELGEEWIRYGYANGFVKDQDNNPTMTVQQCDKERYEIEVKTNWQTAYKEVLTYRSMLQKIGTECMRDNLHMNVWVNALFADYISIKNYHGESVDNKDIHSVTEEDELTAKVYPEYPNWLITDMRFLNEYDAVKQRNGITLRIERKTGSRVIDKDGYKGYIKEINEFSNGKLQYFVIYDEGQISEDGEIMSSQMSPEDYTIIKDEHPSETSLDNHAFDYIIYNDGSIEELIESVKQFLLTYKLL